MMLVKKDGGLAGTCEGLHGYRMIPPSLLISLLGMGWIDLLLRASFFTRPTLDAPGRVPFPRSTAI